VSGVDYLHILLAFIGGGIVGGVISRKFKPRKRIQPPPPPRWTEEAEESEKKDVSITLDKFETSCVCDKQDKVCECYGVEVVGRITWLQHTNHPKHVVIEVETPCKTKLVRDYEYGTAPGEIRFVAKWPWSVAKCRIEGLHEKLVYKIKIEVYNGLELVKKKVETKEVEPIFGNIVR
jgi:hypothetical protein